MRFIRTLAPLGASLLAACGAPLPPAPPAASATVAPAGSSAAGTSAATVAGATSARGGAAATGPARSWDDYKLRAARRIQAASGAETFGGPLPDPLQSIPVLQVQLNRDGSVRDIVVLRVPKQSPQTVEMAMRAIRRAAPFEPVSHLPRPWQFSETFLYNEDLKFQLRTLVEGN